MAQVSRPEHVVSECTDPSQRINGYRRKRVEVPWTTSWAGRGGQSTKRSPMRGTRVCVGKDMQKQIVASSGMNGRTGDTNWQRDLCRLARSRIGRRNGQK